MFYIVSSFLIRFLYLRSLFLFFITHPIVLAYFLVLYSIILSLFLSIAYTRWILYVLVLVFLGGVIVLIIYITRLAANEKIILIFKNFKLSLIFFFLFNLLLFSLKKEINLNNIFSNRSNFITSLIENRSSLLYLLTTYYLLLVLMRVVKIVKQEKGPLVRRL